MTRIHERSMDAPLLFRVSNNFACSSVLRLTIMKAELAGRAVARRGRIYPNFAGGKSGLHRATCRLTAGGARSKRVLRKVPQKNIPPVVYFGGEGGKGAGREHA